MSNKFNFCIIGGGIVGMATAYKLQLKYPKKTIAILEKESVLGIHQTGRNSGVIHSGIYYKPGSYKAVNCKNGRSQLVEFAKENDIPHDVCGKLIVAVDQEELPILDDIYNRGIVNGTKGICYLNSVEIKEKEPFVEGLKAIWVPTAGIIDYVAVSKVFIRKIKKINSSSKLFLSTKVTYVLNVTDGTRLITNSDDFLCGKAIFCSGLFSDRMAENDALKLDMKIVGFRGDYFELIPEVEHKIKNLVYPVPDPNFPFLGVHFTRMIQGGVECGPNAVFTFEREGYKRTSFSWKDTIEAFRFIGTWRLFRKHWRKGIEEYRRAFSKVLFVKALRRMLPVLKMEDVRYCRAGVRAQAIDYHGNMVDDFKIIEKENSIHVLNAPSPAATACLAIADEIVKKI